MRVTRSSGLQMRQVSGTISSAPPSHPPAQPTSLSIEQQAASRLRLVVRL